MSAPASVGRFLSSRGLQALSGPDAPRQFIRKGYVAETNALDAGFCEMILSGLCGAELIAVDRRSRAGSSRFLTMNGAELASRYPGLDDFYNDFAELVSHVLGVQCVPLDNRRVGLSLNYTPPGGGFTRHFDRNFATVSLYLNTVADGNLEIWPNLVTPTLDRFGRFKLPIALRLSHMLDPVEIPPRQGTVVIFSRRTVHGVAPVTGGRSRVSIIMAFDQPGSSFMAADDYYGLDASRVALTDPRV